MEKGLMILALWAGVLTDREIMEARLQCKCMLTCVWAPATLQWLTRSRGLLQLPTLSKKSDVAFKLISTLHPERSSSKDFKESKTADFGSCTLYWNKSPCGRPRRT